MCFNVPSLPGSKRLKPLRRIHFYRPTVETVGYIEIVKSLNRLAPLTNYLNEPSLPKHPAITFDTSGIGAMIYDFSINMGCLQHR